MKERPILFNGEMVRAILEGRKTQTRRPVNPQPVPFGDNSPFTQATIKQHIGKPWVPVGGVFQDAWKKPLGTVGDQLWVRETWGVSTGNYDPLCIPVAVRYFADSEVRAVNLSHAHANYFGVSQTCSRKRPSIHMPRWASRIDLQITRVWVERVQDITEEDAFKEGVKVGEDRSYSFAEHDLKYEPHKDAFSDLWQSIYGTWDANPWVWAYEFRRIKP